MVGWTKSCHRFTVVVLRSQAQRVSGTSHGASWHHTNPLPKLDHLPPPACVCSASCTVGTSTSSSMSPPFPASTVPMPMPMTHAFTVAASNPTTYQIVSTVPLPPDHL